MRIDEILGPGRPTVSFEFFPPKNEQGFAQLYQTIEELKPHSPSYVSVTYGAGGSTRRNTIDLVGKIQTEIGIRAMAHLTCVGHTAGEIGGILDELWNGGIRNVLALRGDPPQGQSTFIPTEGGFAYANELVKFVAGQHNFCVGVAGYPEGHPQ
jgi:methylenetetrahydrofolate reductase (NADPH)